MRHRAQYLISISEKEVIKRSTNAHGLNKSEVVGVKLVKGGFANTLLLYKTNFIRTRAKFCGQLRTN